MMIGLLLGVIALVGAYFEVRERELRRRHAAELAAIAQLHAQDREALHAFYAKALDAVGKTIAYGTPNPPEAVSEERDLTPEDRVSRLVDKQTLKRGVEVLRQQYTAIGVTVTDAELEQEARGIMLGETWEPPASLRPQPVGLPRD